jgi:hypothetical protein
MKLKISRWLLLSYSLFVLPLYGRSAAHLPLTDCAFLDILIVLSRPFVLVANLLVLRVYSNADK